MHNELLQLHHRHFTKSEWIWIASAIRFFSTYSLIWKPSSPSRHKPHSCSSYFQNPPTKPPPIFFPFALFPPGRPLDSRPLPPSDPSLSILDLIGKILAKRQIKLNSPGFRVILVVPILLLLLGFFFHLHNLLFKHFFMGLLLIHLQVDLCRRRWLQTVLWTTLSNSEVINTFSTCFSIVSSTASQLSPLINTFFQKL